MKGRKPPSPKGLDPEQMKQAFGLVADQLTNGQPVSAEWRAWLGEALEKIARDVPPNRALQLVRGVGRQAKTITHKSVNKGTK